MRLIIIIVSCLMIFFMSCINENRNVQYNNKNAIANNNDNNSEDIATMVQNGFYEYKYNGINKKIIIGETTRSCKLSQNKRYLFTTEGTDIVGRLRIIDNKEDKIIEDTWYILDEPSWEGNNLEYKAIIYSGFCFYVVEDRVLKDDAIYNNYQEIIPDHGSGEAGSAFDFLSKNYTFYAIPNMDLIFDSMAEIITKNIEEFEDRDTLNNLLKNKEYKELNTIIQLSLKIIENKKITRFISDYYTNNFINLLTLAENEGYITRETKIKLIKEIFKIKNIDTKLTPWLFVNEDN